jgi:hypothetical protein
LPFVAFDVAANSGQKIMTTTAASESRLAKTLLLFIAVAAISVSACNPFAKFGAAASPEVVAIHQNQAGNDLDSDEPVLLINSQDELDALSSDSLSALIIDFEQESLLIVTLGSKPTTGWSISIDQVQIQGQDLYFQGVTSEPGLAEAVASTVTYPYAAAVISKVSGVALHPEIDAVESQATDVN